MIICKLCKKNSKSHWRNIVVGWRGSELKLGKTPLFQISGECRKFSPDWTIQIELRNILWGSHSQISFFTLRNFLISSCSRRVLYNNFTFIVASIFVSCLIVWDFFCFASVFIRKAQFVTRVTGGFFPLFLPARWWQINVITLSSQNHTKHFMDKCSKWI